MQIALKLYNLKSGKAFIKYFESEYKRECFIRKSKYFKDIVILERVDEYEKI